MKHRIMLVEDEIIVAMDVQQRLETLGYEVVAHAVSSVEAIIFALDLHPDLILMDVKIRDQVDGIQTAATIRKSIDIPVIFVTAFADETTIARARITEAYGYLIKPFEDRELRSAIEIALYKHQIEKKLRESEERYALAAQAANDGIWDWNIQKGEVFYSPRWKSLLGIAENEILQTLQEWLALVHPEDIDQLNQALENHLEGITPVLESEYRIKHRDGGYRWMLCRGQALFGEDRRPYRLAGSQTDITRRKNIEEQLLHRAFHDELTSLPNRTLFLDRLKMTLEHTHRRNEIIAAVLFLDVDHFKIINDSLGHISGDSLLNAFAQRLVGCIRPGDTVARFGGDEFAILVDGINNKEDAIRIAERIQTEMHKPFTIEGHDIFSSASIGITFITDTYHSVNDLLRDVDTAMYQAKNNGRGRYEIFVDTMHERSISRLKMEAEIRRALLNGEFILHYQPVFAIERLELVGFEALIRWQHPTRGILPPSEFINIAEESGLIIPIGEWVLHTACKQAQQWCVLSGKPLKMAVNLSAHQFGDHSLMDKIDAALDESGLDPQCLELELTESVAMYDIEKALLILTHLRKKGISISIDDFGSGYSSLDHIRYIPTNTLKIDRTFIQEIRDEDSAIVAAIITMAHQLRLKVIAEGVETKEQLSILSSIQCDQVQGFLLGKGIPYDQAQNLLTSKQIAMEQIHPPTPSHNDLFLKS